MTATDTTTTSATTRSSTSITLTDTRTSLTTVTASTPTSTITKSTITSTATTTTVLKVMGSLTVDNINFASLAADASLKVAFTDQCQQAIADAAGDDVTKSMVQVTLSPGSVDVSYVIALPVGVEAESTSDTLSGAASGGSLASSLVSSLSSLPGITGVATGEIGVSNVATPTFTGGPVATSTGELPAGEEAGGDEDSTLAQVVAVMAAVFGGICCVCVVAIGTNYTVVKWCRSRWSSEPSGVGDSAKSVDGFPEYCGICDLVCCPQGHVLTSLGTTQDDGWFCDGRSEQGGCKSGFSDEHQTFGIDRFRCEQCDYDLCGRCYRSKSMPNIAEEDDEEMGRTPRSTQPTSNEPPAEREGTTGSLSALATCANVRPASLQRSIHPRRVTSQVCCPHGHPIQSLGTSMDDGWNCDGRNEEGGCRSGFNGDYETEGKDRFRCDVCDYDLCPKCFAAKVQALWANPAGLPLNSFEVGARAEGYVAEVIAPDEGVVLVDIGAVSLGTLKTLPKIARMYRTGDEVPHMFVSDIVDADFGSGERSVQLSMNWGAIDCHTPEDDCEEPTERPTSPLSYLFSGLQSSNQSEQQSPDLSPRHNNEVKGENEEPAAGGWSFALDLASQWNRLVGSGAAQT